MGSSKLTPVSASRDTAVWLLENSTPDQRVYGLEIFPTCTISNYLGRDIYLPSRGEGLKYSPWDYLSSPWQPYHIVRDMERSGRSEAFLVISRQVEKGTRTDFTSVAEKLKMEELAGFYGMGLESFVVYRLVLKEPAKDETR